MSGTFSNAYDGSADGRPTGPSGGAGPWGSAPEPGPNLRRLWDAWWAMPKAFRVTAMVLGFIAWWPIGLALLLAMAVTGRLACRGWGRRNGRPGGGRSDGGWGGDHGAPTSGNRAFDAYREETLRRLEDEQREFAAFLERLRDAKDKSEFDQFMTDRRRPAVPEPQG